MANRAMQAKALKLKKQKRLFPKSYSADYIKCPGNLDRTLMAEAKQRAKGLAFDDKYMEYIEQKQRFKGVPWGRFEVLQQLQLLRTYLGDDLQYVVLKQTDTTKVQLFYNSERTTFLILEVSYVEAVARMSMKYMDRERCIQTWRQQKLRWVAVQPLRSD